MTRVPLALLPAGARGGRCKVGLLVAALVPLAIACGGQDNKPGALSLSAKAASLASSTAPGASASPAVPQSLDLGNGISLDEVRFIVRKLKLEGSAAASKGALAQQAAGATRVTTPGGSGGKTAVEQEQDLADEPVVGPVLVDLKGAVLAAGLSHVLDEIVPAGAFPEVRFAIGPVTMGQVTNTPSLVDLAVQGASIIIDGAIVGANGATAPFEFVSSIAVEVDAKSDIEVRDTKTNNVTLRIDPAKWFGGAGAARLDPSRPADRAAIEANIMASFTAFEDDDRTGQENQGHP